MGGVSKGHFIELQNGVYKLQEGHFKEWQKAAFDEVLKIYQKKGCNLNNTDKMPITVSCDGSYPKHGVRAKSLLCVSFIF